MSVPLPIYQHYRHDKTEQKSNRHVHNLFLTSDERYEIFQLKAAERPHLLHSVDQTSELFNHENIPDNISTSCSSSSSSSSSSSRCDDEESAEPPLIDGCDISGWRKEKLVEYSHDIQSVLNIGASSTMFRRESQWIVFRLLLDKSLAETCPWYQMRRTLLNSSNIRRHADVIDHDEYKQLVKLQDHVPARYVTKFALEYEQRNVPAVILGATRGWKCMPEYHASNDGSSAEKGFDGGGRGGWTFSNLLSRFSSVYMRFSDTHGEMIAFETYAKYISNLEGLLDDSPLGIYDSEFGEEDSPTHELVNEYEVPSCFSPDLFDLAKNIDGSDSSTRPPYRWILIGPERSGTGMHIDPLWTNAWVTVLQGKKRWMLFPPETPLHEIGMMDGLPQINSAVWFKRYYRKVTSNDWPEEWRPVEVLQVPGETVFVPNGWPHLVLNLELTVAVTHNYASEFGPFERMWMEVQRDEPSFAEKWLSGMKETRPDLVRMINSRISN